MRAGRLDRRLELLQPVIERDELTGARTEGYSRVATVWARRIPSSVAERLIGSELVSSEDVVFSIRYRSDIAATWKVENAGDRYDVVGVIDGEWRDTELIIHCKIERPSRGAR